MPIPPKRNGPPKPLAKPGEIPTKMVTVWSMKGRRVSCGHCGGIRFQKKMLLMNTKGRTFLGWEWLDDEAAALVCDHCSHVEWFARQPLEETIAVSSVKVNEQ